MIFRIAVYQVRKLETLQPFFAKEKAIDRIYVETVRSLMLGRRKLFFETMNDADQKVKSDYESSKLF